MRSFVRSLLEGCRLVFDVSNLSRVHRSAVRATKYNYSCARAIEFTSNIKRCRPAIIGIACDLWRNLRLVISDNFPEHVAINCATHSQIVALVSRCQKSASASRQPNHRPRLLTARDCHLLLSQEASGIFLSAISCGRSNDSSTQKLSPFRNLLRLIFSAVDANGTFTAHHSANNSTRTIFPSAIFRNINFLTIYIQENTYM